MIPHALAYDEKWNEVAAHSLLLERMRLAHLLGGDTTALELERLRTLVSHCVDQIQLWDE